MYTTTYRFVSCTFFEVENWNRERKLPVQKQKIGAG